MSTFTTRFNPPKTYEVPEEDADKLRTVLGITSKPGEPKTKLPETIIRLYFGARRVYDLLGGRIGEDALASIVLNALLLEGDVAPVPKPTFREIVDSDDIPTGALLACEWRNKSTPGYFVGFDKTGKVVVSISGSDRTLPQEDVRLAGPDEFPDMKRNVNAE